MNHAAQQRAASDFGSMANGWDNARKHVVVDVRYISSVVKPSVLCARLTEKWGVFKCSCLGANVILQGYVSWEFRVVAPSHSESVLYQVGLFFPLAFWIFILASSICAAANKQHR